MAEAPDRFCRNCGHALNPEDQFCPGCGRPVHETARVPTPEADVPVPPPPQPEGAGGAAVPQQPGQEPGSGRRRHPILLGGLVVFGLLVLLILVAAALGGGGDETAGGGGGRQEEPAAQPVDPFANGEFYTFHRSEDKYRAGGQLTHQLRFMILAGSESESQIDKIARELDYDKSRYELVTAGVLTKDEVTEEHIEEITREHKMFAKVSEEDLKKKAGILVIAHSELAAESYGIAPGEHVYFHSWEEFNQPLSETAAENEQQGSGGQEQETSKPSISDGTYQVGTDIQPGTYRTREGSPNCYYERLKDFTGDMNSILANNNTNAPAIVTIKRTDAGFNSQGCGTWSKDLSAITESKTSFGEGAYIVGTDMKPGTYRNSGGNNCYYERLRDFTGGMNSIIANGLPTAPTIVTIKPTDAGFQSLGCGTWTMLE